MKRTNRKKEQGISLLLAMLALLLMTAIAAGMMFMSSTEKSIDTNFKAEETAYFAARGGVEEVRDRMLPTNTNTISPLLPASLPSAGGGVLYILQSGVTMANVTSISSTNPLADDELCHDWGTSAFGGMTYQPANVRCVDLPAGTAWYTPQQTTCTGGTPCTVSVAPYSLEYKWVRVTQKANYSSAYTVDGSQPGANQVCWNGTSEVARPTTIASCNAMTPNASPVYLVTALAVMPSGARRIVQQEIAQAPPVTTPNDGYFATGTGCTALNIAGNASTGSFNTGAAGYTPTNPPSNVANSNGNVGANGSVAVGGSSTAVNGTIATNLPASLGACPANGVSKSGNPVMGPLAHLPNQYFPPVPPLPNPLPPQSNVTYRNTTLGPGAYGNVTLQGSVALNGGTAGNPAVYTMNSLAFNGNANVTINGPIIINLAGVGQTTVLSMTGGSFSNNTYVPSNFQINYGGSGSMTIAGGTAAYAVINAPNAAISFHGGSNFYGSAVGATIDDQGGTGLYWDTSLHTPPPANSNNFYEISQRELSY